MPDATRGSVVAARWRSAYAEVVTEPAPENVQFAIECDPDREIGEYANFVSVWHTRTEFVLDFAVISRPPFVQADDAGHRIGVFPARVVSRVRLPPTQIFEIMKALEQQLSTWEEETGSASSDGPPEPRS